MCSSSTPLKPFASAGCLYLLYGVEHNIHSFIIRNRYTALLMMISSFPSWPSTLLGSFNGYFKIFQEDSDFQKKIGQCIPSLSSSYGRITMRLAITELVIFNALTPLLVGMTLNRDSNLGIFQNYLKRFCTPIES